MLVYFLKEKNLLDLQLLGKRIIYGYLVDQSPSTLTANGFNEGYA